MNTDMNIYGYEKKIFLCDYFYVGYIYIYNVHY